MNLFVGANDSGKTSVLDALRLFSAPQSPRAWREVARRYDSTLRARSTVDAIEYVFPRRRGTRETEAITLGGDGADGFRSLVVSLERIEGMRPSRRGAAGDSEEWMTGQRVTILEKHEPAAAPTPQVFDFWPSSLGVGFASGALGKAEIATVPTVQDTFALAGLLSDNALVDRTILSQVASVVQGFDSRVTAIQVLAPEGRRGEIYVDDATAGLLPLSSFGNGLQRAIGMATRLVNVTGGMLFIDEIEVGLHPTALTAVFDWLVKAAHRLDVQIFATTHSLEAVDAILAGDLTPEDDTVAYRLTRDDTGATHVKRFGESTLRRLRGDRGLDVR
ncbi:MAG: AAA family ATPase [Byssovorax sp.]